MFLSYVWQFYLPRPSFLQPVPIIGDGKQLYATWLKSGWAQFGWLEVRMPDWVYKTLGLLSAAALVAGAAAVVRAVFRNGRVALELVAFFAVAIVCLLFILHWAEFNIITLESIPFIQGRYILPLIPLFGAAVAAAIGWLPRTPRAAAAGLVVGGLLVLQLGSLGLNLGRYFA
jgi:hypothetical protein